MIYALIQAAYLTEAPKRNENPTAIFGVQPLEDPKCVTVDLQGLQCPAHSQLLLLEQWYWGSTTSSTSNKSSIGLNRNRFYYHWAVSK